MILIEINAIRRSGHHAFINWLISNIHDHKYENNLCTHKFNTIIGNKNILWVNEGEMGTNRCIEYISEKTHIPIVIISYEAPTKDTLANPNYSVLTDQLKIEWGVTEHIQVPFVRDYYNNFSSLDKTYPMFDTLNHPLYDNYQHLYKEQLKRALNTFRGVIYDRWVSDEGYANEVCLKLIGKPNRFNPLEIGGTISSYGDKKLQMDSLLKRYKKTKWPKWVIDKIENYSELKHLIIKAGFNKSDIEIQEK